MPALLRRSLTALVATSLRRRRHAQPSAAEWSALADLPDLGGVWVPDVADQRRKERDEAPPWTPAAKAQIDFLFAEDRAGQPKLILDHCLPHGMPSWMLITHNAMEMLVTPGRITMLGEGDGNRMRRIYTDGRPHPDGSRPHDSRPFRRPLGRRHARRRHRRHHAAVLHRVERGRRHPEQRRHAHRRADSPARCGYTGRRAHDHGTRGAHRALGRRRACSSAGAGAQFDIVEGQCVQGELVEAVDEHGNAIFEHAPLPADGRVPTGR